MQSQFEMQLQQQLFTLYASQGISGCAYAPPAGAVASNLTLRIDREDATPVMRDNHASGELFRAMIWVMQSDVAKVVKGGRFTLTSLNGPEVWTVETTPTLFAGEFECVCSRSGTERVMERRARE
jgi:hypothetical protein